MLRLRHVSKCTAVTTTALRCAKLAPPFHEALIMRTATPPSDAPRHDTLKLRIPAEERILIDRAAEAAGKTLTDFILSAACCTAEETYANLE